ncbi:MAG: hypothetical protein AB7V45_10315 [Candidatus Krumholzibacteriia bacterium]
MQDRRRTRLAMALIVLVVNLLGLQAACSSTPVESCEHDGTSGSAAPAHGICPSDVCQARFVLGGRDLDHPDAPPVAVQPPLAPVPAPDLRTAVSIWEDPPAPWPCRPAGAYPLLI